MYIKYKMVYPNRAKDVFIETNSVTKLLFSKAVFPKACFSGYQFLWVLM